GIRDATVTGVQTCALPILNGEPPQHRLQRALYDAAYALNTLRNKEGTGHGRPWLPSVTAMEARHAVRVMGTVAELLLMTLNQKRSEERRVGKGGSCRMSTE